MNRIDNGDIMLSLKDDWFPGVGEEVIIEGSDEAGDVLMDTSGDFTLQNITINPAPEQVGIIHHSGTLTLNKVIFRGKCCVFNDYYCTVLYLMCRCFTLFSYKY